MDMEVKILADINMTHKSLEEGVQHIIEWIRKQPHLPNTTDTQLLTAFIVGCKSVERAKEKLDKYFTSRTKHPAAFSPINRDPKTLARKKILAQKMVYLPGLTPEGYHVLFMKVPCCKEETEAFSFNETAKFYFSICDLFYKTRPISAGEIVIIDCKGMSLEYFTKFVTFLTPVLFDMYQNSLPIRMKAWIFYNASAIGEKFVNNILRPLMSEKISKRIHIHKEDYNIASKYIPLDMLPSDFGGKSATFQQQFDDTIVELEKHREWFINEGCEGSDESKRPMIDSTNQQLQGTFRKLEID